MYYRRKIILALLQIFDRAISRTDFERLLFILTQYQKGG